MKHIIRRGGGLRTGAWRDLRAYLRRIARNEAYSVLRKKNAGKRKGMPMELHETDCGINVMTIERYMDSCEIKRVMNDYLNGVVQRNT